MEDHGIRTIKSGGKKSLKMSEVEAFLFGLKLPLALVMSPTNLKEEKKKFFESDSYNPMFEYRTIKSSNDQIFSELASLEKVSDVDPRISDFYIELIESKYRSDRLMDATGDNVRVTKLSEKKFKAPSDVIFKKAARVLRGHTPEYDLVKDVKIDRMLDFDEISEIWTHTLEYFGLDDWKVRGSTNIARRGVKIGTKHKAIRMDSEIKRSLQSLKKTIVHEMTHIARYINGKATGFDALSRPNIDSYLDVEEGLASYNEERMGALTYRGLKKNAARVWAIKLGRELTFRELYEAASAIYTRNRAFDLAVNAKRGIGDTAMPGVYYRTGVYFRGFRRVRNRIMKDPLIYQTLHAGKIGFKQLKWVEEGLIPKPKFIPTTEDYKAVFKQMGL